MECALSVQDVTRALEGRPAPFALYGNWAGGGAVVGSDPLVVADANADPFATLDALPAIDAGAVAGCGVVGGGWFGWLGYRLGRRIERLPEGPARPVALPEFHLGYYDHVLRLDPNGRWWFEALVGQGADDRIARRLDDLRSRLIRPVSPEAYEPPAPLRLAPGGREHHLDAVGRCRERIEVGEIYQANICLRLESHYRGSVTELFARALDHVHPTYGAAFATSWGGIASLSPELFLRREGREVTTAPIKGTVRRPSDERRARAALAALRSSTKDAAEHVMIVDLMRNDLGRVSEYGSVVAPRTPDAEAHPGLWHLVTQVRGRLRSGVGDGELLRATFPPGSVTGAPKVQAMRVISELESTGREVYTGAIGFASPVAGLELNVAIRTFELRDGVLWMGAGGGIVADSDPAREFDEALAKARPLAAAIGSSVAPVTDEQALAPSRPLAGHPG